MCLLGFLALYFVDVTRLTAGQAALGIAVWSGLGLLGDFLLIPLLEKVRGLDYLRCERGARTAAVPGFSARARRWSENSSCWACWVFSTPAGMPS